MSARVLNIAHRGGAGLWPENTMAAFEAGFALGADGAELDVQLTKDGRIAVFHDHDLKPEIVRDASGRWLEKKGPRISQMTFAELQAFDVGRLKPGTRYAETHPEQEARDGERIPLLDDVVALAKRTNKRLWIELKTPLLGGKGAENAVTLADAVIDLLQTHDAVQLATFVAFDWAGLVHAKRRAPGIETRFTTLPQRWFADPVPKEDEPPPPDQLAALRRMAAEGAPWEAGVHPKDHRGLRGAVKAAGGDGWFPYFPDVTPETAAETKAFGLSLAAWTVNDPAEMRRLIALGADGICTDRPDLFPAR